jgi:F0F1-type ATP synthase gamma subunit
LFVDYDENYAIIELIGEWNDAIENDIQTLKRNIIDLLIARKIYKYILIGENILTFHSDGNDYYEEWYEDIKDEGGWIVAINFSDQTLFDFRKARIHHYVVFSTIFEWRTLKPEHLFLRVDNEMIKLLE